MKPILSAVALLFGLTIAANAAEPAPYMSAAHDWRGPYLGLQAGGAWGDGETGNGVVTTGDYDLSGAIGGYTAGYNWQSGNWVFGIESDTSLTDFEGSTPVACGPACYTSLNWFSTTRVRLGWATGNFLPYITGGLAYGEVEYGFSGLSVVDDVEFGWAAGAGIEAALNDRWSAKIEYLHADLGDVQHLGSTFEVDDINIVRAGVNYKFDLFGYVFGR